MLHRPLFGLYRYMDLIDAVLQENKDEALAALEQWGVRDRPGVYKNLRRILATVTPPEFGALAEFLDENLADNVDPDRALNNLERYHAATVGPMRPTSLATARPYLLELLLQAFGYSQFMADFLIRYPHYAPWLAEPATLTADVTEAQLAEGLRDAMAPFEDFEFRQRSAVRWLRSQMLRVALRVIRGVTDEPAFCRELSALAKVVIRAGLDESARQLRRKWGVPLEEGEGGTLSDREAGLAVIAMGKLGADELNFSSDVDLIFVYSAEGRTTGVESPASPVVQNRISNHDYFARLCAQLMDFLGKVTEEGYLYRVDARLRPDGDEGPLARSLSAYEIYHETQARPWERMALVKAAAVAGDETLGASFEEMARGLVFGVNVGPEIIGQVRALKEMIDSDVGGDKVEREVKRGRGGIREIEFYVQTHQLLHGRGRPELQVRGTLEALERLVGAGRIDPGDADQLASDYIFLRRLEHRLQMVDLRQTHLLPDDPHELDELARRMGIGGGSRTSRGTDGDGRSPGKILMRRWRAVSDRVHGRFTEFFGSDADEDAAREPADPAERVAQLIANGAPDREFIPLLTDYGLESGGSIQVLKRLGGRGRSIYLSQRAIELFPAILPHLLQGAAESARPSVALGQMDSFLAKSGAFSAFYEMFASGPNVLRLMMKAFGASNFFAETLIAHPEYVDYLLDPRYLAERPSRESLEQLLGRWIVPHADEPEAFAAALARFRRFRLLMTGLAEVAGLIDGYEAAARISEVADVIVEATLRRQVARVNDEEEGPVRGFAALAMGKYGARELNYYSDLDIVFAWDDAEGTPWRGEQAADVAQRITATLKTATPEGLPYSTDMRLRPEGASAPLAPPVSRYLEYYAERADLWELQSLMKIRGVAGDPATSRRLLDGVIDIAARRIGELEPGELERRIVEMRKRIEASVKTPQWVLCDFKKGPGGVIDLEFLAQYFQLKHFRDIPELIGLPADRVWALLAERDLLEPEEAKAMSRDYAFLRRLESRSRLLFETESSRAPAGGEKLESLTRVTADLMPEGEDFTDYLLKILRSNRARFDKWLAPRQ